MGMTPPTGSLFAELENIFSVRPRARYTMAGEGLYMSSQWPYIREALEGAGLKAGETFLDLGSGDGRVVCAAAVMGARARGIEADLELHRQAMDRGVAAKSAFDQRGVPLDLEWIAGNFLDHSFGGADLLFYYAGSSPKRQKEIYEKLDQDLRPGARLIVFRAKLAPALRMEILPASRAPYYYIYRQSC